MCIYPYLHVRIPVGAQWLAAGVAAFLISGIWDLGSLQQKIGPLARFQVPGSRIWNQVPGSEIWFSFSCYLFYRLSIRRFQVPGSMFVIKKTIKTKKAKYTKA